VQISTPSRLAFADKRKSCGDCRDSNHLRLVKSCFWYEDYEIENVTHQVVEVSSLNLLLLKGGLLQKPAKERSVNFKECIRSDCLNLPFDSLEEIQFLYH
jgi:hypothetical protein